MKNKKSKPLIILAAILLVLLYVFVNSVNLNPLYAEGAIFWAVLISAACLLWVVVTFWEFISTRMNEQVPHGSGILYLFSGLSVPKTVFVIAALPWLYIAVMSVIATPIISSNAYRNQLGETETRTFSSDIQVVDTTQLPIVDADLALKLADKKLGEKPSLGSQVMLGEPTLQMVDGNLTWAVPLHHSGFFKWLANMSGAPGYVTVSATNVNDVKYVEQYKIKYQPNSFLLDDLLRHARFSGSLFEGLTDYSFELDDTGKPYWVISTYKNTAGFALPEAKGVMLVDAGSGEIQQYAMDNIPDWVDRVQPEDFIIRQINNRGEYIHGIFNFSNKDKYRASRGSAIVYNEGECYLVTCVTSVGTDESAIGFMMVDMVTKQSHLYEMAGATESSAQRSAEGKVQHLGYGASFPIIINVSGQPSYFMTLKDKEGLIKQYALVSVVNYSTVGTGETVAQAMTDYQKALSNDSSVNIENDLEVLELSGTVNRIASEFNGDTTVYKLILNERPGKIFTIDAVMSEQLALTAKDDRVKLSYRDSELNTLLCTAFENLTIK
ncbi:MAG: hypothetical protein RR049_01010 [Angelakisella sp.]